MNVAYIKPVERYGVWIAISGFGVSSLAVLLRFGELGNDGDLKLLACELNRHRDGLFLFELYVANTVHQSVGS